MTKKFWPKPYCISLLLHGAGLSALYLTNSSVKIHRPQDTEIELISPQKGLERTVRAAAIRKQSAPKHAPRKEAPIKEFGSESQGAADSPVHEAVIGKSEVGPGLDGRSPENEEERYLVTVRDRVRRHQRYPRPSRVFREEGLVKILMTLDQTGAVTKLELLDQSIFPRLNEAAMQAVADSAPFPQFPTELRFKAWQITVPIRFLLSTN